MTRSPPPATRPVWTRYWTCTACATPMSPTWWSSTTPNGSSPLRSGTPTPRLPPSTPACPTSTATACCADPYTDTLNCGRAREHEDELPLAPAHPDGRTRTLRHQRPRPATSRTRRPPVPRTGLPPGHHHPATPQLGRSRGTVRHPRRRPLRPHRNHRRQRLGH